MKLNTMFLLLFLLNLGYIVDYPTPYVLSQGSYDIEFRIQDGGKVIGRVGVSPFENFYFGVSYGGRNLIGKGALEWHSHPGVQIKLGAGRENLSFALGFDSETYETTPIGIYGVLGGDLGWKVIPLLGVNYCDSLSIFCGVEAGITNSLNLGVEACLIKGEFALNSAIRWNLQGRVIFEIDLKDILSKEPIRALKFSYTEYI